jgi:hypothetical protein
MGDDEASLVRLWKEKRGEVEPEDLSGDLLVQLGAVTEHLNRQWYEKNTGQVIIDVQRQVFHSVHRWMAATLDGRIEATGAVFEAKFMLPWNFSEEAAAEKHMAQLQHNTWVTASRTAVLSIITGGGKWVEITIPADPLYQHLGDRLPDGRPVDHHRRRQMGGDHHSGRSALPAPSPHRGAEILALRRDRRAPSPVRHRTPAASG